MSKYRIPSPSYIPLPVWLRTLWACLFLLHRSPAEDGSAVWHSLRPCPVVLGSRLLPERGPFVVCANHYNGPGVWVGLTAALLCSALGSAVPGINLRGVGVASYENPRLFGRIPIPSALTEIVFRRFYAVYGAIRMPNGAKGAQSRSSAVRAILRALKAGEVVLLFPEGRNVENFAMRRLQPGIGALATLVSRSDIPIVPTAVYRVGDCFTISFAKALEFDDSETPEQVEERLGYRIAKLLPETSRGVYAT